MRFGFYSNLQLDGNTLLEMLGPELMLFTGMFFIFSIILINFLSQINKKFGLVPEFKSGINMGEVTAAEVGILKREIAYHGDVLNTAARIQQLCNEYGKSILTTKIMADHLPKRDFKDFFWDLLNFRQNIQRICLQGSH